MKSFTRLLFALSMLLAAAIGPYASAGDADPLFINLTTDEPHRANMGITFGRNQLERGHPLTIFMNDKAVLIASKQNASKFAAHQKSISELLAKGAIILVCPMCMKHYGVAEGDLLPGLKVGNAELTGAAVFKDNAKSLTW